jgi:hypothetical protein
VNEQTVTLGRKILIGSFYRNPSSFWWSTRNVSQGQEANYVTVSVGMEVIAHYRFLHVRNSDLQTVSDCAMVRTSKATIIRESNLQLFGSCTILCEKIPTVYSKVKLVHVRLVPCHHGTVRPQVVDGRVGLQIWCEYTADKWWSSNLGAGHGHNNFAP